MVTAATGHALFDALANRLQELSVATIGTDLFILFMPEGVSEGMVILDNYIARTAYAEIPGYRRGQFRVVVRSHSYLTGFSRSEAARVALLALNGVTIDGVEIKAIEALHDPLALPPSSSTKAAEFVVSYAIAYGLVG